MSTPSQGPRFELEINGEAKALAGLPGRGVLSAILTWVQRQGESAEELGVEELALTVGGLDSAAGEHVRWGDYPLQAGDEIRIRILEPGPFDAAPTRLGEAEGG